MILAVASGKGGTGKTTVAVNLAMVQGRGAVLLDCDVEEPNVHLFLQGRVDSEEIITIPVPHIDDSLCKGCGECSRFCEFNAIALPGANPIVFEEMCHGCGGCTLVCPTGAISEQGKRIGVLEQLSAGDLTLVQGRLDVGVALVPPLIRAVKEKIPTDGPAILDAPPGTSCPVIATLRSTDGVILVTEPTPFGLHDLTLAVEMVRKLEIPFGVVINRAGAGDERVHAYCWEEGIPILEEIPDDRRIAEAYSRGNIIVDVLPEYIPIFQSLLKRAGSMINEI